LFVLLKIIFTVINSAI